MDAPRDLFLTNEYRLCEAGSPEAAFLFHRKGQVITTQEEVTYAVTAYLERTSRAGERAERQRIVAEVKAVEFAEVENKAVAEPVKAPAAPAEEPTPVVSQETLMPQENPIPPPRPPASDDPGRQRIGSGRRG
jgi:hypothetical protein